MLTVLESDASSEALLNPLFPSSCISLRPQTTTRPTQQSTLDPRSPSTALTFDGTHEAYKSTRIGTRGGVFTAVGVGLLGVKLEAEFDRSSSQTLTQKLQGTKIRWSESEDVKQAHKLCQEALRGLAELLERVQFAQYTEATDIASCREAWEDSVEASYRDSTRINVDQCAFKKLVSSKEPATAPENHSTPAAPVPPSEERTVQDRLAEELIELVDDRRASRAFWEELFLQVPVGHDEGRRASHYSADSRSP